MSHTEDTPDTNANDGSKTGGESLADVVRDEQELPRERLRRELNREPSEDEVKDWLRQHTEGY